MASQLYQEIAQWAQTQPELIAYEAGSQRVSYGELLQRSEKIAQQLEQSGSSVFAFALPSGVEFLATLLAGLCAAKIVAPLPLEMKAAEFDAALETLQPHSVLLSGKAAQQFSERRPLLPKVEIQPDVWLFTYGGKLDPRVAALCPNGGCIRFTSGTTGAAKGVIISAESARERIVAASKVFALEPQQRVLSLLSMPYHFIVSLLQFLRTGATIVQPQNTSPAQLISCAAQATYQVIYAAPFHYDLLSGSAARICKNTRLAFSTSTKLRPDTARRFREKFGIALRESYGIIEVGIPIADAASPEAVPGSIGFTLPDYQVCLAEDGTLLVRGPGLFDAYLSPFTAREAVLKNGWFPTSDLAQIDGDGRITLSGRSGSAIHVAGFKVFPEEIEVVLLEHYNVIDAHVMGVAHPVYGNTIHAKLVLRDVEAIKSEEEILAYCRKQLGTLKTPHSVEFIGELDRTLSGKLRRGERLV